MSLIVKRREFLRDAVAKNREIKWLVFALVFLSAVKSGILIMWSRRSVELFTSRRAMRTRVVNAPAAPTAKTTTKTTLPSPTSAPRPLVQKFAADVRHSAAKTKQWALELSSGSMKYIKYGFF
jgi:hypothetical protein